MSKFCEYCSDKFIGLMDDYSYSFKNSRTYAEYVNYINMLCNYLERDFIDIDHDSANRFMTYMYNRRSAGKLSRGTIYVRLHCYKVVAEFLEEHIDGYESPFRKIRFPDKPSDNINPKRIPSMQELDRFMSVVKSDPMYSVIYALATRVGLSATSILNIRIGDISREEYGDGNVVTFLRLDGKGFNKERYIALPRDVSKLMEAYLSVVVPVDGAIWFNEHKRPLTLKNLVSATKRYVTSAGSYWRCAITGQGNLPLYACLKSLRESGYSGWLIQEFEGIEDPIYAVAQGLRFTKRLLQALDYGVWKEEE